ncbi:MAG: signal peptide peptidase SppA, partial [Planctomycetota bacterium]
VEAAKSQPKSEATPKAKVRYAQMVLSGEMPELIGEVGPFGDLRTDLRKVLDRFDRAAKDDRIEGIVLDLRSPGIGRGNANELREAIKRFRKSGKKVHAQLEIGTTVDYLIACACDEIVMPESGFLLMPGVRAEPVFYRGLLTKLGVKADFLHMGEAKGAGESFTQKKWSEPVKANLTALLDSMYEQMVDTITHDRPLTEQQAREAIDLGMITAADAKERGLVDRLAYPDELRSSIGDSHADGRLVYVQNYGKKEVDTDFSGPAGFFKLMGMIAGGKSGTKRSSTKKIAVIYAIGPIMTGKSEQDLFGSQTIGSTTIVDALDKANRDDNVAAIVLRVNSPGGSAVASDLIWRKTQEIDKPIVASMGDVAASGGYYISMGADRILCEPSGVTGSIGVVSGKFAVSGMYKKLGLTTDLISRGENSGLFSGLRKWSDSERAAMLRMMEDCYDQFTSKAAAGREMPVEQLKKLAGGKVYTGVQAKANGLIDDTGTLADAIAAAKDLAGIDSDEDVKTMVLPEPVKFFEAVFGNVDKEKEVRLSLDTLGLPKELSRAVGRLNTWRALLEREPVGLFMPYDLVIE